MDGLLVASDEGEVMLVAAGSEDDGMSCAGGDDRDRGTRFRVMDGGVFGS